MSVAELLSLLVYRVFKAISTQDSTLLSVPKDKSCEKTKSAVCYLLSALCMADGSTHDQVAAGSVYPYFVLNP